MRRVRPGTRAFTLIELLVVIGVIALLLAILLPALAGARESSRATACTVNVRSIGQSLAVYADDQREVFPHWSAWQVFGANGTGDDTSGPGWAEQLDPYTQTLKIHECPSRRIPEAPFAYFLQSRYTAMLNRGRLYTSLRHAQVVFAQQFVLAGDENNQVFYPAPYGFSVKAPECDADDARWPGVFFGTDQGQAELTPHKGAGNISNIAFLDGHAGAFKKYEKNTMTWHGREMRDWAATQ